MLLGAIFINLKEMLRRPSLNQVHARTATCPLRHVLGFAGTAENGFCVAGVTESGYSTPVGASVVGWLVAVLQPSY